MSDTLLEHPLVRDYLRRLDEACAGLPYAQARELIEQITARRGELRPRRAEPGEMRVTDPVPGS